MLSGRTAFAPSELISFLNHLQADFAPRSRRRAMVVGRVSPLVYASHAAGLTCLRTSILCRQQRLSHTQFIHFPRSVLLRKTMKSTTNIHFTKNNQTRFVKHGFSWQLFFFGPLAFLMRGQWPLALACSVFLVAGVCLVAAFLILAFDAPDGMVDVLSLVIPCALVGHFGNRISARSYVKNGWAPVDTFPSDWNIPQLIAPQPADTKLG